MIDFSGMTPAQIRIMMIAFIKDQKNYFDHEDPVAHRQYELIQNQIDQCLCALHNDRQLEGINLNRESVMAEAMQYAISQDMGIKAEDLRFVDNAITFKCATWQSVSAMVKKFQHKAEIMIESINKGSHMNGGGYQITAFVGNQNLQVTA